MALARAALSVLPRMKAVCGNAWMARGLARRAVQLLEAQRLLRLKVAGGLPLVFAEQRPVHGAICATVIA